MRTTTATLALLLLLLTAAPRTGWCDIGDPDEVRVGLSIGGTHVLAVDVEFHYGLNSVGFSVGTWLFEDLTLKVTGRRYLRESTPSPYVGVGLWSVTALTSGLPTAAFLNVPAGIDWRVVGPQNIGAEGDLNAKLGTGSLGGEEKPAVERSLLFLPAIYLRWGR